MKNITLLLPTNDFVFKKVFSENIDLLGSLLSAAPDLPEEELQSIVVTDAHLRRETIEDKDGILDIKVKTKNSVLDVEIQVRNQPPLCKRIQYYLHSLYVEQLKSGVTYAASTRPFPSLLPVLSCLTIHTGSTVSATMTENMILSWQTPVKF